MFLFTMAFNYKFLLATLTEHGWATAEMSRPDADRMLNGQSLEPNLWVRFSLLGGLIVLVLLFFASLLSH
jgi:hypothetical protein